MRSFCGSVSFERMVVRSAAQRLESHRAAGHLIILLSASPLPITKPIAEHFVRPQPSPQRNPGRISKEFSGRCRDKNEGRCSQDPSGDRADRGRTSSAAASARWAARASASFAARPATPRSSARLRRPW